MKTFLRLIFMAFFLFGLFTIPPTQSVYAAGIIVNSNADTTTTDGLCTLREAITNANTDTATYPDCTTGTGNDIITFAGNYTITLTSTLPDISQNNQSLTITGNGTSNTIIQAAASAGTATYRIIKLNGASTITSATFEYMTFRYGGDTSGAAINNQTGTLTLNNMVITNNQIPVSSGLNGGAISQNGGTTTINNSTISNNSIGSANTSSAGNGGGIFVNTGTLNLNNTTVSGNTAYNSGGGVYVKSSSTVTINNSTISGNTASNTSETTGGGGGLAQTGTGTVTLNNVTISGNSAVSNGAGLLISSGTVNSNYNTIVNNNADSNSDATGDGGGIYRSAGTLNLESSIVAGNKKATSTDNDCSGTLTSLGYNLTGSSTGCSLAGTGDVTVTASTVFTSVMGSLTDNGGSTYTHALVVSGSAVNAIPSGTNSCGTSPFDYDQRGGVRPYNSSCDIGAYELKTVESVSTTGTDSGDCTITDCASIAYAYGKAQAGNTINVAAGTYTETSGYDITKSLTISGAGAMSTIVQAAASAGIATHRFFKVNGSGITVNLQNLTFRYGVEASGGALNVGAGTLNLTNVILSDNQVNNSTGTGLNGGAISVNGAVANITNSAIINNSVTTSDTSSLVRGNGGGVFVGSTGTITLNNTTVSGNSSIRGGGGLFTNGGTINVNYSTIANNTSDSTNGTAYSSLDGGGIGRNGSGGSGTINLKSSIVAGNKEYTTDNDCTTSVASSQGYNLTGTSTGCSLAGTGDVTVTPSTVFTSVLGSLANNGGNTYTHLLYGGNAAQDAIANGTNSCGSGTFAADQLGNTRPYNTNCDMGAYESQDARPSVSMSSTASNPTNISPIAVTVTFSESVTGFTSGDITPGNATVNNFAGSGASYSFDLTPSSDGTVTADIAAGVAQDSVYNYNTAATQLSISYDGTPPAAPVVNSPANGSTINDTTPTVSGTAEANSTISVYFDSSLDGTTTADSGGSWSYTPSSALTANTSHNVKVKASDAAGNTSVYSNTNTFTIDTSAPSIVSISRFFPASASTNASSVDFFVVFSEGSLSGVDTSDFTLTTTGSISSASVSIVTYSNGASATVTVNTGSGDGTIRLDVADDDSISDGAGNKLGGTGTGNGDYTSGQTFTIDKTAPTVSSSVRANSDPTNASSVDFTVTFSESVTGVDTSDFDLTLSGVSGASITGVTGSGTTRTVSVSTGSGDGTIRLDVLDDDSIVDALSNPQNGSFISGESYTVDKTAPTVSSSVRVNSDPTNASSVDFTVTFSESVTGVDTSDFDLTLSGVTGASITGVTGSGTTRTVSVSTGSGDGTIRLDVLDDDSITDTAGNTLNGAFTSGESYTADKTEPTITIYNPDTTAATSKTITASSSDGTISMSNTTGSVCDGTLTFSTYTSQTFTSESNNGTKVCYKAVDTLGNTAYSLSDAIAGIDTTAPTVSSIALVTTSPSAKTSVQFTVTFSESVSNVETADFSLTSTVTGASVSTVSGSGATRTVTVSTGTGNGTIRLDIPNTAVITDQAGNAITSLPYTSGASYTINKTLTYTSTASQDGWILESTETSNTGGTLNTTATTFNLGDDALDKQYRAILSFNTASIPDNATISQIAIKIKRIASGFLTGNNNPFSWGSGLKVDVCQLRFGTTSSLQLSDFGYNSTTNCKLLAATFGSTPSLSWYSTNLISSAFSKLNKTGLTQFRLRFAKDDNDDSLADYLKFYSGNATAANRPQLVITYSIP